MTPQSTVYERLEQFKLFILHSGMNAQSHGCHRKMMSKSKSADSGKCTSTYVWVLVARPKVLKVRQGIDFHLKIHLCHAVQQPPVTLYLSLHTSLVTLDSNTSEQTPQFRNSDSQANTMQRNSLYFQCCASTACSSACSIRASHLQLTCLLPQPSLKFSP